MLHTSPAPGIRERLSYRFDRFMERGTIALILGLAVVSVVIIVAIVPALVLVRGDEVAIGHRVVTRAKDPAAHDGVVLNPDRRAEITFSAADRVIVVAEE